MSVRCWDCGFGRFNKNTGKVVCYRYPPSMLMKKPFGSSTIICEATYPAVDPLDWCGEYKEK